MNAASWYLDAARRYDTANRETLEWILARSAGSDFLDTKVNPITGADYGAADGLRGGGWTYGWIQGRGLEALASFARHYAQSDPALAARLEARAGLLYRAVGSLLDETGHAYFLYGADGPVRAADMEPQRPAPDIYTYSDAFVAKGLVAAAALVAPEELDLRLDHLRRVIAAVEDGRFQMSETGPLSAEAVASEPDDFGPRMILLGSAGMLHRAGLSEATGFADRFIDDVLDRYMDPATGILFNVPGEEPRNLGHTVEFVGFALDHLHHRDGRDDRVGRLGSLLERALAAGLRTPGIPLLVDVATGEPASDYHPWWSVAETIRATALLAATGRSEGAGELWRKADRAFFGSFWQPGRGYAHQTLGTDGPVDYVPATPDLDPAYHTALSLRAAEVAARAIARNEGN